MVTLGFSYWWFIKVSIVNSHWHYDDNNNKKRTSKIYKYQQIYECEDEEKQNLPADYENNGYIHSLFFFKNIKLSSKPGQENKELDLFNKYKIKEIPGKVLIELLRVFR